MRRQFASEKIQKDLFVAKVQKEKMRRQFENAA